jgi:2-desacetyl-2-hydroxyethyl bacteriochlorophyllide A dehydrogenase
MSLKLRLKRTRLERTPDGTLQPSVFQDANPFAGQEITMNLDAIFDTAGAPGKRPGDKMRAIQITSDHAVKIIDTTVPAIGPNDILVRPTACGICGTDLHILKHGFPGTNYPVTPGHEFAGDVIAVGREVRGVKEGDFVAVDPNVVCGHCRWCLAGRPNLCLHLSPIGVGQPGAAAEYVSAPARNSFAVNRKLGADVAALIEPLACAVHAVESAQGVRDKTVLVLGGGTMGLLIAIVAQLWGAGKVTLADPVAAKHEIAKQAGISDVVDPRTLGSECFDVVFEAAGVPRALEQALILVEKTGALVQVGVHDEHATSKFLPFKVYEREIRIIGSNSCADKFELAVDVMSDIRDKASVLLGTPFRVWEFGAAVESMIAGKAVKTQLSFD